MQRFHRIGRGLVKWGHKHSEAVMCRGAALPQLVGLLFFPKPFAEPSLTIRRAYAAQYWRVRNAWQCFDIAMAVLLWPFGVLITALRYTSRNGALIASQCGRSIVGQFGDQLRLAVTTGMLPPWYYIFELYRPGRMATAAAYLTRGETKRGVYRLLADARGSRSPLSDKAKFAQYCAERQLPAIPVLLTARDGALAGPADSADRLPRADLFIKPVRARGGRGAERWDHLGGGFYRHDAHEALSAAQFLERLRRISLYQPCLLQERARNHPSLLDLSNGALNTLRVLSCLDEQERPEIIGAVLRLAVGRSVTVDNVHAGGLHAAVDLETGTLSQATDMGLDVRFGWVDRHPQTGALIAGRTIPFWAEALTLVRRAHMAFRDWAVVGWDVAILADGPILVEGNAAPDVDLMQRPLGVPFGSGRFGQLLAFHCERALSPRRRTAIPLGAGLPFHDHVARRE